MSTEALLQQAEHLYDAHAAQLVLYGRVQGLSHAEAEHVLQEVFRAWLAREVALRCPVGYLLRSYRNRALNHRRLWRHRLTQEWEAVRWFEPVAPEDPAADRVTEVLATLPPDQREVIVLKIWHRQTFAEIARLLDISPNTATGRFRYGLARLRRTLEELHHEPAEVPDCPTARPAPAPPVAPG